MIERKYDANFKELSVRTSRQGFVSETMRRLLSLLDNALRSLQRLKCFRCDVNLDALGLIFEHNRQVLEGPRRPSRTQMPREQSECARLLVPDRAAGVVEGYSDF